MKLKLIYFLLVIPLVFQCCETEGFIELDDKAVFFIKGEIDGQSFDLHAGENGVINNANVVDQEDRWDYISSFSTQSDPTVPFSKLSLKFNDYQKLTDEASLKNMLISEDLDYVLNFTGSEGLILEPETSSISDPFVTAWTIDGRSVTTQVNPIIPLPFLEESRFIDVRYSLNIANKFRGTIISQFSQDLESSCHGEILMNNNGLTVDILLNPLGVQFDEVEWSTGANDLSTVVESEAQEIVVEASSANCQLSAQLEITDPEAIPQILSYNYTMSEGPASFSSNTGIIIEIVRNDGTLFRSDFVQQSAESSLSISSVRAHQFQSNDLDSYEVSANMVFQLSNLEGTEVINVNLDDIQFALAHPNP